MTWQALINVWPCAESSIWSFRAPKILEFISIQYLLYWRHIKNKGTTLVKAKLWNQEIIMVRKSSHRMALSQIWNNMTVRHPMRSDCDSTGLPCLVCNSFILCHSLYLIIVAILTVKVVHLGFGQFKGQKRSIYGVIIERIGTNVTEKGRSWVRSIETIHRWSRIKIITWSETRLRFVKRRYWTTSRMRVASLMGILRKYCVHAMCNNARQKVHATSNHTKTSSTQKEKRE